MNYKNTRLRVCFDFVVKKYFDVFFVIGQGKIHAISLM